MTFKVYECVMYIQFRPCFCWFDRYRSVFRTLTGFWIRSQFLFLCARREKNKANREFSFYNFRGKFLTLSKTTYTRNIFSVFCWQKQSLTWNLSKTWKALEEIYQKPGIHIYRKALVPESLFKSSSSLRSTLNDIIANKHRSLQK